MASPEVKIDVALETKKSRQELEKLNVAIEKMASDATRKVKRVDGAFSSFVGNLAASGVSKVFSSITSGFSSAAKESLSFARAQKEIETILPNNARLTRQNVEQLKSLSQQFGTRPTAQAKAFYQVISAGVTDTTRATKLLSDANKLSTGGLADVQGSVELLAKTLNVYGKENITSAEAADSLFTTVRLGITTIPSLNSALAQVLPNAKAVGVSFDEVNAALAVLTKNGESTETGVVKLRQLFTQLSKNAEKLGADFQIGGAKGLSFAQVLENISKKTNDTSIGTNKLFGNVRAGNAALILANSGAKEFISTLGEYESKAGAAARASEKIISEDTTKQFEILQANLFAITDTFVKDLLPTISSATKAINDFLNPQDLSVAEVLRNKINELGTELDELTASRDGLSKFFRSSTAEKELGERIESVRKKMLDLDAQAVEFSKPIKLPKIEGGDGGTDIEREKNLTTAISDEQKLRNIKTQELLAERLLIEEEARIRFDEINGQANENDLERLRTIEVEKLELKATAKEAEAQLIQNEDAKIAKINQLRAKTDIDTIKLSQKQRKAIRDQEIKDEQAFFSAATSLASSENKTLAAIGKAAGLLQIAQATPPAIASSYNFGARIGGPFLGATFGGIAFAAQAAQAANMAKFANGGFITSGTNTGDSGQVSVNRNEAILNSRQQNEFMRVANGNGGSSGELNEKIDELIAVMSSQPVNVMIDGREVFKAVREQQLARGA